MGITSFALPQTRFRHKDQDRTDRLNKHRSIRPFRQSFQRLPVLSWCKSCWKRLNLETTANDFASRSIIPWMKHATFTNAVFFNNVYSADIISSECLPPWHQIFNQWVIHAHNVVTTTPTMSLRLSQRRPTVVDSTSHNLIKIWLTNFLTSNIRRFQTLWC